MAYWASFAEYLKEKKSSFRLNRPNKDHWHWFAIGRAGFGISSTISAGMQRIGVELYISNDADKLFFHTLLAQKDAIEKEFGEALDWQELPGKKASRIALFRLGVDPSDDTQFPDLHHWMMTKMDKFKSAFAARVKALPLTASLDSEDSEPPDEN